MSSNICNPNTDNCCPAIAGEVIITPGVITIPSNSFYYCVTLTSVVLPAGMTSISAGAFFDCENLVNVVIPNSVTDIGDAAFAGCTSLPSVVVPEGVISIGPASFNSCTSLTSVVLPESLTTLLPNVFSGCGSLPSIVLPSSLTAIPEGTFSGCNALNPFVIPANVTDIGATAFYGCSSLTSLVLPDGVLSISTEAFVVCTSLTSVTMPEGLTIGDSVFNQCTALPSIDIPSTVTTIGVTTFYGCTSLTSVSIPEGMISIGRNAFDDCTNLTSLTIPSTVTSLGDHVNGEDLLTTLTLPNRFGAGYTNKVIVDGLTIAHCPTLPDNQQMTYSTLFAGSIPSCPPQATCDPAVQACCPSSPGPVTITYGVTSIADSFYSCQTLTSIVLPDTVTAMGNKAFFNCFSLTSVVIGSGVTYIPPSTFSSCSALTSVTLPETLTDIGNSAFYGCLSLTSINIPSSVTNIENSAFQRSGLTTLVIPSTVTSLHMFSLWEDLALTTLTIPNRMENLVQDYAPYTYALGGVTGFNGFAVATCPYYSSNLLMSYSTNYVGSSPACTLPASTCSNPLELDVSCPPQTAKLVLCLSAPASTCTTLSQCGIVGVYSTDDTSYSHNLLVPLPTLLPGTHSDVYTAGENKVWADNKFPLGEAGLMYDSAAFGFTNIYLGNGSYYILNDISYSATDGAGYIGSAAATTTVTKAPTTANIALPLSAAATAGIISGVLLSFAFCVVMVAFFIIGKRRAAAAQKGTNTHPNPLRDLWRCRL